MAAQQYYSPFIPTFSSNGAPVPGASLVFYTTGTTTKAPVYADAGLTTPLENPVPSDAAGKYPAIYLDDAITYRVGTLDPDGVLVGDYADPYFPAAVGPRGEPGGSDNTYTGVSGLADFKASDITRATASLVGVSGVPDGRFNWTLGNFTGQADDVTIIKADSTSLSVGAWVRARKPYANLKDYGGRPDGSNSSPALARALAAGATEIIMEADGDDRLWYFGSAWPVNDMAGVTINAEPVVTLSHATSAIQSGAGSLIRYARPTKHILRDLGGVSYFSYPESRPANYEKPIHLGDKGPDFSSLVVIQPNVAGELSAEKISWPSSDTWTSDTLSGGSTGSSYGHSPSSDASFHIAFRPVLPGRRYYARPGSAVPNPLLTAIIRHSEGFVGITADTAYPASIDVIRKTTGVTGTSTATGFEGFPSSTHASYLPLNSEWAIEVESYRTATVYFNNMVVARLETEGFIYDAGFGMYPTASGQTVSWNDLVEVRDQPRNAGQLLSIAVFGDSRHQPRDGCPADYIRPALDLSYGIRCWKLDNFAVGGQDSNAQLAVMEGVDLGAYNHVHINIGTNDAQGLGSLATFKANIAEMANLVRTAGAFVSFGIFPLWYTQGQAGTGVGQASVNYEAAAPYRSAIRRFCAENGYKLVDLTTLTGPVVAQYVNPSLVPNLVGTGDPVMYDNIHKTSLFNRIEGEAVAQAIAGTLMLPRTFYLGPQELEVDNGWAKTTRQPTVSISADGWVTCAGGINDTGSAVRTDGTRAFLIPPYARPEVEQQIPVSASDPAVVGFVTITPDGNGLIWGFPDSTYIDLSTVQYPMRGL